MPRFFLACFQRVYEPFRCGSGLSRTCMRSATNVVTARRQGHSPRDGSSARCMLQISAACRGAFLGRANLAPETPKPAHGHPFPMRSTAGVAIKRGWWFSNETTTIVSGKTYLIPHGHWVLKRRRCLASFWFGRIPILECIFAHCRCFMR